VLSLVLFYVTLWLFTEPKLVYEQLSTVGADQIIDAVIVCAAASVVLLITPMGGAFVVIMWLGGPEDQDESDKRKMYIFGGGFALAATLGPTFLAAFLLAFVGDPPLPAVDVGGSQGTEGTLLTHVDGYWYVFEPKGTLVAVPDAHVTNVNICAPTTGKAASICTQRSQDHKPAQPVRKKHPAT
jgi:hypothetical protein